MQYELEHKNRYSQGTITVYQQSYYKDSEWQNLSREEKTLVRQQRENSKELEDRGLTVRFGVDVTRPRSQSDTQGYNVIEYRHPHSGVYGNQKSDDGSQDNECRARMKELIIGFFETADYKVGRGGEAVIEIDDQAYPWSDGGKRHFGGSDGKRERPTLSLVEIAAECGWQLKSTGYPDDTRGERNIGVNIDRMKGSVRYKFTKE